MKIIKELTVNSSVDAVWEVLGNQFGDVAKWASIISQSELSATPIVAGTTRSTNTTNGPTKQRVTSFDPANHRLAYEAISGAPFFIKSIDAMWSLSAITEQSTKLVLDFSFETKGIAGVFLGPVAKIKLGKVGDALLDDFKVYVETGVVSDRKKKAIG